MLRCLTILLICLIALPACNSTRGLRIYSNGQLISDAYETAQWPWVLGEFGASSTDGQTSATLGITHDTLGGVGLAAISAVVGYAAAGTIVP